MARIVARLMAKKPGGRYQTVTALIADLERLGGGAPRPGAPAPLPLSDAGDTMAASGIREPGVAPAGPRVHAPPPKPRDAPTLDLPAAAVGEARRESGRFAMETVDGEEEAAAGARVFGLLPSAGRRGGLDAALLVAAGVDPPPKVFLFSKEIVRFGRQAEASTPEGDALRVDLILRLLPCRSEKEDPENYRRNLTISRHHGAFRLGPREAILADAGRSQGLAVDGAPVPPGGEATLPPDGRVVLSRGALELRVRVFREERPEGFAIRGETAPLGERGLVGMEGTGRIAAVRIERAGNAPGHAYVLLARHAAVGAGDDCPIRFPDAGGGARIYYHRREYFLGSDGGEVSVDGRSVPPGSLAPLSPGARIRTGGVVLEFRLSQEEDFKKP
jgi:hypothetical protein